MAETITKHLRQFAEFCFVMAALWFAFELIALVSMWSAIALAVGVTAYLLPEAWNKEAEQDG